MNETEAYKLLLIVEEDIEEIVEIVDAKDVPILETFYAIINKNFHYIYECLTFKCCETKE
jgi:hypothetical protein